MATKLNPGFTGSVRIQDLDQNILYQKSYTSEKEVQEFITKYSKSKPGWGMLRGMVIPLRTNNLKNFSNDFFLPTYANFSSKINNRALKIFASIFAIFFDALSLPIRFIATPIRAGYNLAHKEQAHPLMELIKDKAKDKTVVELHFDTEIVQLTSEVSEDEKGNAFQNGVQKQISGTTRVALVRIPGGIKSKSTQNDATCDYLVMNGEWTRENSSQGTSSHYSFAC